MKKIVTALLLSALSVPAVFAAAQSGQTPPPGSATTAKSKHHKRHHVKKHKNQTGTPAQSQTK